MELLHQINNMSISWDKDKELIITMIACNINEYVDPFDKWKISIYITKGLEKLMKDNFWQYKSVCKMIETLKMLYDMGCPEIRNL